MRQRSVPQSRQRLQRAAPQSGRECRWRPRPPRGNLADNSGKVHVSQARLNGMEWGTEQEAPIHVDQFPRNGTQQTCDAPSRRQCDTKAARKGANKLTSNSDAAKRVVNRVARELRQADAARSDHSALRTQQTDEIIRHANVRR